jgi:hypothetical protein
LAGHRSAPDRPTSSFFWVKESTRASPSGRAPVQERAERAHLRRYILRERLLRPAPKATLPRAGGRRARPNAVEVRAGYLRNGNGCAIHYQLVQVSPRCPLDRCTHLISTLVREILASPRATPHSQCQRLLSSSASSEMNYDARWRVLHPFCDAHGHISDNMATRECRSAARRALVRWFECPASFAPHRSSSAVKAQKSPRPD